MSDRGDGKQFRKRFTRKLRAMVIVLAGALILSGTLLLFLLVIPVGLKEALEPSVGGDWKESARSIRERVHSCGSPGERAGAYFLLQVLQVLVAPIPGQLMGLVGGYLFGFWSGLGLTMLGLAVGSLLAMGIGRTLGRAVVEKFVSRSLLRRFQNLMDEGGVMNFFVIFLVPALPDDAVCFMAGLTRLPLSRLMLACMLGRLPGMAVLAFLGSSMESDPTTAMAVFGVGIGLGVLVWIFDDELRKVLRLNGRRSVGAQ